MLNPLSIIKDTAMQTANSTPLSELYQILFSGKKVTEDLQMMALIIV